MEIGKKYHIHNGYAKTLDEVWFNNSELTGIVKCTNGLTELEFTLENGKSIVIDGDLMQPFDAIKKTQKGYMWIEKIF